MSDTSWRSYLIIRKASLFSPFSLNTSQELIEKDTEAEWLINHLELKEQGIGDIFVFSYEATIDFPLYCSWNIFDNDKVTKKPKGVVEVEI